MDDHEGVGLADAPNFTHISDTPECKYTTLYKCSMHTDHWALAAVCSTSSALKLNWTPVAVEPTCTR